MKSTINAIKVLVKARNKKYGEVTSELPLVTDELFIQERISWNDRPMLVITGFEASAYFAQMKSFLEPMICRVCIQTDNEVHLKFD